MSAVAARNLDAEAAEASEEFVRSIARYWSMVDEITSATAGDGEVDEDEAEAEEDEAAAAQAAATVAAEAAEASTMLFGNRALVADVRAGDARAVNVEGACSSKECKAPPKRPNPSSPPLPPLPPPSLPLSNKADRAARWLTLLYSGSVLQLGTNTGSIMIRVSVGASRRCSLLSLSLDRSAALLVALTPCRV